MAVLFIIAEHWRRRKALMRWLINEAIDEDSSSAPTESRVPTPAAPPSATLLLAHNSRFRRVYSEDVVNACYRGTSEIQLEMHYSLR